MKHLTKENFYISYLRFFYDIPGDLDEYQINELNRFGSQMFLLIFSLMWGTFFLTMFTLIDLSELAFLLSFLLPLYYQHRTIKRLGLDKIEIEHQQLKQARQKMFKRTLWQTLTGAILSMLTCISMWRLGWITEGSAANSQQYFYFFAPVTTGMMTLIIFIILFFQNRRRIVIID